MSRRLRISAAIGLLGALLAGCSRQPSDELKLGSAIALTGNASLLGQDARTGLQIAEQHFGEQQPKLKLVLKTPAATRPVRPWHFGA